MSDRRPLASGDVLAHRYELQDLVSEKLGSSTWRAHDRVLHRNVGIEMLSSSDPRADHFLEAARESTAVTDPRFLRVLDLIEDEQRHHLVVREWARAFPLDQVLAQSPLPSRRAATVVAEVAEAIAHAHEHGVFHRRLSPHQVLLKQSGAVRVVGLGVSTALAPAGRRDSLQDLQAYERLDVEGLGKLLYACLVSRWPGGPMDGLPAAPEEHDRLLRPRQVRAGISRDVDTVCDRILGDPPRNHETPLRSAAAIARTLRLAGDEDLHDDEPSLTGVSSPDLLRLDPVIVPAGPPPGLEPPRRRPKAYAPAPPTVLERSRRRAARAAKGDRGLVLLGVIGTLVLASVLAFLVGRSSGGTPGPPIASPSSAPRDLPIVAVSDFDPQGEDRTENRDAVDQVIDGSLDTGWTTSTYFGNPELGGLKDGVGLVLDLGSPREVDSVRVRLGGEPTDLSIFTAPSGADEPRTTRGLRRVASLDAVGSDASVTLRSGQLTRYVVLWLRRLPEVAPGEFRGEVREVVVRGRS
jgi:hypothetical protein